MKIKLPSRLDCLKTYTAIIIVILGHNWKSIRKLLLSHWVEFEKVYYNYYCHSWSLEKVYYNHYCHTWSHWKKYTTITIASFGHIWINWLQFFVTFGHIWSIIQSILSHLVTFEKVYYNHNWHIWSHLVTFGKRILQ